MVLLTELQKKIKDASQIYERKFDKEIDQSAIYENVYFVCLDSKYSAIVLTPVCDIVTKETEFVTVAQIVPAEKIYTFFLYKNSITKEQILGVDQVTSKKKENLNKTFIDQYVKNRTYRYHFLPKKQGVIKDSFICFEIVQTILCSELTKYKKIAVLRSPWKESVPSRYAAYCLRIGTPTYSNEFLTLIHQNIPLLK